MSKQFYKYLLHYIVNNLFKNNNELHKKISTNFITPFKHLFEQLLDKIQHKVFNFASYQQSVNKKQ